MNSLTNIFSRVLLFQVLEKCFSGGFFGEDKDGDPVWYDNFGNLDFKGVFVISVS